nr:hypothetical protein CFP56_60662 [Quercus suber]
MSWNRSDDRKTTSRKLVAVVADATGGSSIHLVCCSPVYCFPPASLLLTESYICFLILIFPQEHAEQCGCTGTSVCEETEGIRIAGPHVNRGSCGRQRVISVENVLRSAKLLSISTLDEIHVGQRGMPHGHLGVMNESNGSTIMHHFRSREERRCSCANDLTHHMNFVSTSVDNNKVMIHAETIHVSVSAARHDRAGAVVQPCSV